MATAALHPSAILKPGNSLKGRKIKCMLQLKWTQPANDYPTSDGKPMGETDVHRNQMVDVINTLAAYFKEDPQVYVTGNLLWFYQQHDKRRHISPDCMVVFGVPKGTRENYLQWEEGTAPQVVFELTSKSTRKEDLTTKFNRYIDEGVEEYYLFDPREEYLKPRFRAYRRSNNQFIPVVGDEVFSPWLGLKVTHFEGELRFRHPQTNEFILSPTEAARLKAETATALLQTAANQLKTATRMAERECQRAERERERAEQESERAENERQRAERMAQKLRELGIEPD